MAINRQFVSRMQYNADKELLFITVPGAFGSEKEITVEMEHLEIIVPYVSIGAKFLTANDEDGFFQIKDLNKQRTFIVSKRAA